MASDPLVNIAVLRNIVHNLELGMDIRVALQQTANELEQGVKLHRQGKTESLTHAEAITGQLIGRNK